MSGTATEEDRPGLLGRVPLHPVLLAAWPALVLWASNADEVRAAEALPYVWMPAAVALLVTAVVAPLMRRDLRRSATVAAALALAALFGGNITNPFGPVVSILWLVLVVGAVGMVVHRISSTAIANVTSTLNVLGLVLVALSAVAIVPNLDGGSARAGTIEGDGGTGADIWYVVPDRYPRQDTLAEVFDFDNEPFLDALRDRGFDIGTEALANYPKTAHSLASTWNLAYVDELVDLDGADPSSWAPLYSLLRDHALGRTLQEAGYDYTHLGTWWSPTAVAQSADRNIRFDARSEFAGVYLDGTVFLTLAPEVDDTPGATGSEIREGLRDINYDYTRYQLDALDQLATESSGQPRFVLAHVTQPHEPYVFDRDGSRVTADQADSRTREDNVVRQIENLNTRLLDLVDTILERDPDAVIVIQSDEGPHPRERTGPSFDWTTASTETLEEKLRILSAIRLPGGPDLPDDRTSVNTWRWVLNTTIGSDLPVLEDRIAVFPGEDDLYTLVDVTSEVD